MLVFKSPNKPCVFEKKSAPGFFLRRFQFFFPCIDSFNLVAKEILYK